MASPSSLNHCVVMCSGFSIDADDGDRGRRVDRAAGTLIVERAIAAGDGRIESAATFGQAAHAFAHLPEQFRLVRIGHVQIVRRAERHRAGARKIAARFGHGGFRAFVRIEINVAAIAIHGHGDEFLGNFRVADFCVPVPRSSPAMNRVLMRITAASLPGKTTEPSRT